MEGRIYTSSYGEKENISPPPEAEFSEKELNLFSKRYDEGYDLYDQRYDLWLQRYVATIQKTQWFVKHYLGRSLIDLTKVQH